MGDDKPYKHRKREKIMLTIKTIFDEKEKELGYEQEELGRYVKSYNGFVDLRYDLVQDIPLEEEEYDIYQNGGHLTLKIMKSATECVLLKTQNAKVDEEKVQDFSSRLAYFAKKHGKETLKSILVDKNLL